MRWKYKVEATGVASDIVRVDNQIYFVTIANDLVCLDLPSGKPNWAFHDAYSPQEHCVTCASPAVSEGRVYFGGRDGFAYAVEAQSGKLIWKFDCNPKNSVYLLGGKGTRSDFVSTPVVQQNRLYIGVESDCQVATQRHRLNPAGGSQSIVEHPQNPGNAGARYRSRTRSRAATLRRSASSASSSSNRTAFPKAAHTASPTVRKTTPP